jgi:GT2 family glycosyltransferase
VASRVSIVIPAFNQLGYCRECVESILVNTGFPYRLILVDNGSTDGVGEYFESIATAIVVHTGENLGFPAGVNRGLAHADGHVLLLNSDTIVPRGWLTRLVAALESHPRIGAVGPMTNHVSGPQLIPGVEPGSMEAINRFANERYASYRGQLAEIDRLVGFCLLIRDEAFSTAGLFDESFGIGNFEDDDYCIRIRKAGYRVCVAEDCFVFHYGSRTFRAMGIHGNAYNDLINRNEDIYRRKWGLTEGDTSHTEQIAAQLVGTGRDAAKAGATAEALRAYTEAIATCPVYDPAYNDLGVLLWGIGKHERAYDCFARAALLNPDNADAVANLRDAADALGKPDSVDPAAPSTDR